MKRYRAAISWVVLMALAVIFCPAIAAQGRQHLVMFYNVENFFDTLDSPGVLDEEFTPVGSMHWNSIKYRRKMENLDRVFSSLATESARFPTIIGLAEVENRSVLEDLVSMPGIAGAGYRIVHHDSPDTRGIDVALLYRPDLFAMESNTAVKTVVEGQPEFTTRDMLAVAGTIDGERFMFVVAHWPSRTDGQRASEPRRMGAARTMRAIIDEELGRNPYTKIVIMGDLNDDPSNRSVAEVLGGRAEMEDVRRGDELFNPFYRLHRDGYGSIAYRDQWNMFDNILVNGNLTVGEGYRLWKPYRSKYWGFVYDRDWLRQQSGQYKGYPHRTYVGDRFEGGYSDHFPVYIFIYKPFSKIDN